MSKYAQGRFNIKNPNKYLGNKSPLYRSSWEFAFMKMCDENPAILKWASEAIKIPYRNPFTGKHTVYVPDFFIHYIDAQGRTHTELIEVKPKNQTSIAEAKKSVRNQAHAVLNAAKWEAARAWCKQNGVMFRIVNEGDIFHNGRR
jgi:TnsA endonuclease N terminal